jgi:hypothetical protein
VRLHRIDENASGKVAPLLALLRELQRRHGVAVLVVHHARKGAGGVRAGQALRGSSEFHAWGDSNLYLRRDGDGDDLSLTVEHRVERIADACMSDIEAQCGDAERIGQCLVQKSGSLSQSCRIVLAGLRQAVQGLATLKEANSK